MCALVTSSAVKMRSDMNTIVPQVRESAAAATRTAPARFLGPSHPSSLDVRMAPVITIGFPQQFVSALKILADEPHSGHRPIPLAGAIRHR